MEQPASPGRIMGLSGGQRERHRRSGIRSNQMNLGGPSPAGLADGLRAVFLPRTGSIGMNLHDCAVHRHHFRLDLDELFLLDILENLFENPALRPVAHPSVHRMPTPEPGR